VVDQVELPKVNIALVFIICSFICSSLGGLVWYASNQASIIANLEEAVIKLADQSNTSTTEKVNMVRDISENKDDIGEIVTIISEIEENVEVIVDIISEIEADSYNETEKLWEQVEGISVSIMRIVELQQRVALLERTINRRSTHGKQDN
tara:strand:- start:415 stop:864 length:450 start_codon:yes stop_codon:yes gene_type:complete